MRRNKKVEGRALRKAKRLGKIGSSYNEKNFNFFFKYMS